MLSLPFIHSFSLSTNQKSTSYISKGLVVMHCHALSCGRLFSFVSMICSDSHSIYFIVCVCLHDTDGPFRSSLYLKKWFIGKGRFPDQRGQSINRVRMHCSDECTSRKRMCCIYGTNPMAWKEKMCLSKERDRLGIALPVIADIYRLVSNQRVLTSKRSKQWRGLFRVLSVYNLWTFILFDPHSVSVWNMFPVTMEASV